MIDSIFERAPIIPVKVSLDCHNVISRLSSSMRLSESEVIFRAIELMDSARNLLAKPKP